MGAAARTPAKTPTVCRTPGRAVGRAQTKSFNFDGVYGGESSQEDLFSQAAPLVDTSLAGENACIFAYGQTGTGKTHTMMGSKNEPGIVPRAVERIWERIDSDDSARWLVDVTFVE